MLHRPGTDTALGPIVVTAEPVSADRRTRWVPRRVRITSSSERFDPVFSAVATGDSIVFVNDGPLNHRLFTADLPDDLQIPVKPFASSAPFSIHRRGELSFFCSLHPEENFGVLVTADAPSDVTDENGWYDIWPLADGKYRLSIWSRRVSGPVRVVEVVSGRLSIETIWIDPNLMHR